MNEPRDQQLEKLTSDVRAAVAALLAYSSIDTLITLLDEADPFSPYLVVGDGLALKRLCRALGVCAETASVRH